MDVAESPEQNPRSPEDEEEQPALSDDDILRESGSDQDLDGAAGRASDLEDEENTARAPSQEEENRSDEEDRASEPKSQDQDSEAHELNRGPAGSPCEEEADDGEEDRASDLRDEASSVTRELDEHELDYDEEVPEEPAPAAPEDEAEKTGAEEAEKGEGAPAEEGEPEVQSAGEKGPPEAAKEKKKEDDDGEIDDGEIDVSMREQPTFTGLPALHRGLPLQDEDSCWPLFLGGQWAVGRITQVARSGAAGECWTWRMPSRPLQQDFCCQVAASSLHGPPENTWAPLQWESGLQTREGMPVT